ncbi:MAG: beta-ketoacyl-[acyl-carrier-protein] synthase family protein [Planctomycetes bacterium]|nr:beta-ketoacyl-[acyl-carrier-protein] synthase family protein [Planctomycetota bacterium]MCB9909479.1 beta-ketoacyl-[acyl-carrier-protein] synthase family protein [Planctomycetota bacterium]HPF13892.1 beta-ketoacyl-[acyl-carrier-protein] synthase family protein [Planctomycetota bacterium]HRV80914.1 beta-ketoacyl-[acyl-carrier-protein] synthase family protein [Planctomycetota bacterium]
MADLPRVVITGVGLTSPNGNHLAEFRANLLSGVSGVVPYEIRYFGPTVAGVCHFEATRYQNRKALRRGTRAGSIAIYCANEAVRDAGIDLDQVGRHRVGVYVGTTEHGNVETEQMIHEVSQYDYDLSFWSHHHNPRTVANNPAGEITLNLGITGPHYCIGGACAGGNLGLIQGVQMLQLGQVDLALAGGVSESIHTFGIFASFQSEGALGKHEDPTRVSRPFDKNRNGIVVSEGGCLYTLERLEDARRRGAHIYAEVLGYHVNSDATDFVLPNPHRQNECMRAAIAHAGLEPEGIHLVSTHATSTPLGDIQECQALREVFGDSPTTHINNTKSFVGHTMGAAGSLELAGNLPSLNDGVIHPTINIEELDPDCDLRGLVINEPKQVDRIDSVLNLSFGMLGINSAVVIGRPQ